MSERAASREVTRVAGAHGVTTNYEGHDEDHKCREDGNQRRAMLDQSDTHQPNPQDALSRRVFVAQRKRRYGGCRHHFTSARFAETASGPVMAEAEGSRR